MLVRRLLPALLAAVVGGLVVFGIMTWASQRDRNCPFSFVNPLRCDEEERFENPDYAVTEKMITTDIAQRKNSGLSEAGVYFRDLRNGPSISIGSQDTFLAMSLLKLPIMIYYLKTAENDPTILDQRVTVTSITEQTDTNFPIAPPLQSEKQYSIKELLQRMVKYSDNDSRTALLAYAKEHTPKVDIIFDTLNNLGIVDTETDGQYIYVSLKSVSSIFRILYNASYLNPEESNLALDWLSESAYDKGIAQPIPTNYRVANKFGAFTGEGKKELHDCGIVYYPVHPYLLCIMTRGDSTDQLQDFISATSATIYQEVVRRFGGQ